MQCLWMTWHLYTLYYSFERLHNQYKNGNQQINDVCKVIQINLNLNQVQYGHITASIVSI